MGCHERLAAAALRSVRTDFPTAPAAAPTRDERALINDLPFTVNGQLGARVRLSERWMVGLDGELNGWFGVNSGRFAAGAFNGYGTVIFRTPLRFANFNLRTTANAGVSTLLIDLYGAPRGTTGLFLGLTPLGLEWKVSSHVFIVLDAIGIALPIPQLKGAPFAYPQYRAAIGVELAL